MTIDVAKKRRARRIASDEAHAWARSLPLDNPYGKTVLRALTLYVNAEGCCFVSIDQLADDTDLSIDTVRRRLVWLENVGALVRLPQWIDENGKRNSEGKGRRTTDEIRLLVDADLDEIERKAKGDSASTSHDESPPPDPSREPPQDFTSESASPQLAPRQPSHSSDHLISEPEPEDSPQPPSGGSELEAWSDFEKDWAEPIVRTSLAQQVWSALKPDERELARKAARGYVAWRKSQRKPPNVLGAHLFLKECDAWPRFAALAPVEKVVVPQHFVAEGSIEWRARNVIRVIAGENLLNAIACEEGRGERFRGELSTAQLALARFADDDPATWQVAKAGTQPCGAWRQFLEIEPRLIVVGYTQSPLDPTRKDWPIKEQGLRVPMQWPPRRDGTLSSLPPGAFMTDDDVNFLNRDKAG